MKHLSVIIGAVVGAFASLLARPEFLGITPDFTTWFFSESTVEEGWFMTILVFMALGAAAGFGIGIALARRG